MRIAPGVNGGNAGAGVAYDPRTGWAFLGGIHQPVVYSANPEPYAPGR
ncbi:MAG: quinonprotein alcohol dehydrogenase, partial [Gemmatimonadetes bacterium]|nr:quinonprotein alcohol dehydrogenase [Gemmatimonadota bacterium]NIQ60307.1 quinonprotein alcohol dehydrogenase [Gemmatimonadota bacterium]NIU80525.1 quinonprotein alcohol dehydrogenase [Gammaproteobacteria bacterium]NIX48847.1 quinonprotein alcohol dehydrogenase [Gemmatimonadota bacterium]NIY13300.1 quinonprotein alcohol dehydrogenase [Gemmatimonadota bacterium]